MNPVFFMSPNFTPMAFENGENIAMRWSPEFYYKTFNFTAVASGKHKIDKYEWTVKGDIAIDKLSEDGKNCSIRNSNRFTRFTTFDAGQGKGRLILKMYYKDTIKNQCKKKEIITNSEDISIDIYKVLDKSIPNIIPPINGVSQIEPNMQYTFWVEPILSDNRRDSIGNDRYEWDVSGIGKNAYILFGSQDSSYITIQTPSVLADTPKISCCFGICNFNKFYALAPACSEKILQGNGKTAGKKEEIQLKKYPFKKQRNRKI